MTILVDEARWEWRGLRWAHLVSDESHDELHSFARRLGMRRLGFQGDHYDVEEIDRERALEMGATAVESRVLVRQLRAAGLRDRTNKPRWEAVDEWPSGTPMVVSTASFAEAVITAALDATAAHARLLADPHHVALLLDFGPEHEIPVSATPWATGRRAGGSWSAEFFLGKTGLSASPAR